MSHYIKNLINQGEHQQLDFKFEIADSRKIAKTLVAFANTDGGKILVGVKDNGAIAGVRSDEEIHMVEAAAQMYCKPQVKFTTREWDIEGKNVLEISVEKDALKPYYAKSKDDKWLVYIRVNDQNLLANKILLRVWGKIKKNSGVRIKYTEAEKFLLQFLKNNNYITLSAFSKKARISRYRAETILVNFIVLKIIDIVFTEKLTFYTLHEDFNSE